MRRVDCWVLKVSRTVEKYDFMWGWSLNTEKGEFDELGFGEEWKLDELDHDVEWEHRRLRRNP